MKHSLYIAILSATTCFSQTPTFRELTTEPPKKKYTHLECNLNESTSVRVLTEKGASYTPAGATLQVMSNGKIVKEKQLLNSLDDYYQFGENLVLFLSRGGKSEIYSIFISSEGEISGESVLFNSTDNAKVDIKDFNSFSPVIEKSQNGKYLLVYDVRDDKKKNAYYVQYGIMGENGEKVNSGEYAFPNKGLYHSFQLKILNDGSIFLKADLFDGSSKYIKEHGTSFAGTLLRFNGNEFNFEDLKDDQDQLVDFAEFTINGDDYILQPKFSHESGLSLKTSKVNWSNKTLENVSELSASKELYTRNDNTKDEDQMKTGYKDFKATQSFKLENNHQVFLFERMRVVPYIYNNIESPIYYYDEVIIVEVNNEGEVVFIEKVEKKHTQRIYNTFIGSLGRVSGNTLTLMLNDNTSLYSGGNFKGVEEFIYPESRKGANLTFVSIDFDNQKIIRTNVTPPSKLGSRVVNRFNYSKDNKNYIMLKDKDNKIHSFEVSF